MAGLSLTQIITCPKCDQDFEGAFNFPDRVEVVQDITDDDITPQDTICPKCGHLFQTQFEGWHAHDDAG